MTRIKSEKGNHMVTIASKVTIRDKEKIRAVAKAFGLTFYELQQSLLLAFLRYFDSDNVVTYDHNCMMNAFANTMYAMKDSYCPLNFRQDSQRSIKSAILFVKDSKKRIPQLLLVRQNEDGQLRETFNFDKMVLEFLGSVDPECLQRLENKKKELGYFSITHTLHEMILQRTNATEDIKNDIEEMFTDIRIPSGEAVNDDIYYRRAKRTNVDEYTTIHRKQTFRADL